MSLKYGDAGMGKTLKALVPACILALTSALPASAGDIDDAKEALFLWQPIEVSLHKGSLTVVLSERQITEKIYMAVITTGICVGPLTGKGLSSVQEVKVLNQFEHQGYVYEAGTEDCARINDIPVGDSLIDILVAGKTHAFTPG